MTTFSEELYVLAKYGHYDTLIALDVTENAVNALVRGATSLIVASASGHHNVLELLLTRGANVSSFLIGSSSTSTGP